MFALIVPAGAPSEGLDEGTVKGSALIAIRVVRAPAGRSHATTHRF